MLDIPEPLSRRLIDVYGQRGADWLADLSGLIAAYERRWSIRVETAFPGLTYNYVAPAVRADGSPAVLKLGVPDAEHNTEIAALRVYAGRGAARLLEADPDGCALLLERLSPGEMLTAIDDDDEATRIAAAVMRSLWHPVPANHAFPPLKRWTRGLSRFEPRSEAGAGPLPTDLVERAQAQLRELLASAVEPVVLHGDLHHFNILRSEREPWLAIDPKGVAGEPVFDTGTLLLNPVTTISSWPDLDRRLARRIAILSEVLGFDRERIRAWAFVEAVLSACWHVEDHGDGWQLAIAMAGRFAALQV